MQELFRLISVKEKRTLSSLAGERVFCFQMIFKLCTLLSGRYTLFFIQKHVSICNDYRIITNLLRFVKSRGAL